MTSSRSSADKGEAKEVEGFRSSEPALLALSRGKAAELDQTGLIRMQHQRELLQPLPQHFSETLGVYLVLETNDEVVRVADHYHVARGFTTPPSLGP